MPATPQPTAIEVKTREDTVNRSRLVISKKLRANAKGAVKTTIELLGVAAQMTQSVPYLGMISTALTEFMKIRNEVSQCKDECKLAMDDAEQINLSITKFRDKCVASGRGESGLNETLQEAFTELERVVLECVTILQKCKVDSKRKTDRLRLYWKRAELLKSVTGCNADMSKALRRFDRTLHVDAALLLYDIRVVVGEIHEAVRSPNTLQRAVPNTRLLSGWQLRAPNQIFHGRTYEVERAIDLIVDKAPARLAILGPGGIGKTSIALAVLHYPKVEELYGVWRCFMSCEASATADVVVRALAKALRLHIDDSASDESAQHYLLSYLRTSTGIICLDNLETPLETDKHAVGDLLNELFALPRVALLVTSRETNIPTLKWTSPPLEHIEPYSLDAALSTWDDICHGHDDYALKLAGAVDCMPLAVTLLARLTSIEGSAKNIWARWETERTDLVCTQGGKPHRLHSLGASIEMSLRALGSKESIETFSIICIFSDGLHDNEISRLDEALKGHFSLRRAITLLKQFSLVHGTSKHQATDICVLSPIRHHMQQHHTSDEILFAFLDVMMQPRRQGWDRDIILRAGVSRPGSFRERCLDIVISRPNLTQNIEVLSQAVEKARLLKPQIRSPLHRWLGVTYRWFGNFERARTVLSEVIKLDEQLGDRRALFLDWTAWISTFAAEFRGREDECMYLDQIQEVILKTWKLGCDPASQVWDQELFDYEGLASAQHFINEGRRKLHTTPIYRSGLYLDNNSTVKLDQCTSYQVPVETSSQPWDLPSVVLESLKAGTKEMSRVASASPGPVALTLKGRLIEG